MSNGELLAMVSELKSNLRVFEERFAILQRYNETLEQRVCKLEKKVAEQQLQTFKNKN